MPASTQIGDTGSAGDFDGDGRYDQFRTQNGQWQIKYAKGGSWKTVNTSNVVKSQTRYADFNGDGKDDVMHYRKGTIQYVPTANVAKGWTHHVWSNSTTHCGGKRVTIVATGQRTVGTEGNDVIYMSPTRFPTDTTINGHKTNRHIGGRGSNDIICGNNAANNYIVGGTGNDKLYGGSNNERLYGGPDNDAINAGPGNDQINGNAGNDAINAGPGNDSAWGESGNDRIWGYGGNDRLFGQAGVDHISGGLGVDSIDTGTGIDTVWAGGSKNNYSPRTRQMIALLPVQLRYLTGHRNLTPVHPSHHLTD